MTRLERESGLVERHEMHPSNFSSDEFARRVEARNGRPLPTLEERAWPSAYDSDAAERDEEYRALQSYRPTWSRVSWSLVLVILAVVAVMVACAVVIS